MTDDGETDHATEKCLDIGGIACASVIPPNNMSRGDGMMYVLWWFCIVEKHKPVLQRVRC